MTNNTYQSGQTFNVVWHNGGWNQIGTTTSSNIDFYQTKEEEMFTTRVDEYATHGFQGVVLYKGAIVWTGNFFEEADAAKTEAEEAIISAVARLFE